MGRTLIQELEDRGLIAQVSDLSGLRRHFEAGSRTLYCGFDPSADSLHIGNLVPLMTLRRFQAFGHRPILLLGGATGLIGDPSGRSDERGLNKSDVVADWVERIKSQVAGFLDFEGNNAAIMTNNLDWTQSMSVIEFLRDVGKHFSVLGNDSPLPMTSTSHSCKWWSPLEADWIRITAPSFPAHDISCHAPEYASSMVPHSWQIPPDSSHTDTRVSTRRMTRKSSN